MRLSLVSCVLCFINLLAASPVQKQQVNASSEINQYQRETSFETFARPIRWIVNLYLMRGQRLSAKDEAALPWHLLSIPSYANWTSAG